MSLTMGKSQSQFNKLIKVQEITTISNFIIRDNLQPILNVISSVGIVQWNGKTHIYVVCQYFLMLRKKHLQTHTYETDTNYVFFRRN